MFSIIITFAFEHCIGFCKTVCNICVEKLQKMNNVKSVLARSRSIVFWRIWNLFHEKCNPYGIGTFEAIFVANRTINLRPGGLRSCQKIGWHLIKSHWITGLALCGLLQVQIQPLQLQSFFYHAKSDYRYWLQNWQIFLWNGINRARESVISHQRCTKINQNHLKTAQKVQNSVK